MTYPEKPAYGSPCNGCGLCCLAVQCPLSEALFGEVERCPAIAFGDDKIGCGLVLDIGKFVPDLSSWGGAALSEAFALMLGAGLGCDGTIEGEEPTDAARMNMRGMAEIAIAAASPDARELVAYFRGGT